MNTKQQISGVILLNKPKKLSSNKALNSLKKKFKIKKAGHTGTLDPNASGLLPICINGATKLANYFLSATKSYEVKIRLGQTTISGDSDGEIIDVANPDNLKLTTIKLAINSFLGVSEQIPPMHSAIKINGTALYKLARAGKNIDRAPRQIQIYNIDFISYDDKIVHFKLKCSKGTYIRQLAIDIGNKLKCGAYVVELKRTKVADLSITQSYTLNQLNNTTKSLDNFVMCANVLVNNLQKIIIDNNQYKDLLIGKYIKLDNKNKHDENLQIYLENMDAGKLMHNFCMFHI